MLFWMIFGKILASMWHERHITTLACESICHCCQRLIANLHLQISRFFENMISFSRWKTHLCNAKPLNAPSKKPTFWNTRWWRFFPVPRKPVHAANRTLAPHFDGVGHSFQTVQKEGQDLNFRRLQTSFTARMSRKGLVGDSDQRGYLNLPGKPFVPYVLRQLDCWLSGVKLPKKIGHLAFQVLISYL